MLEVNPHPPHPHLGLSDSPVTPPLGDVDLVPSRRCTRLVGWQSDSSERLCDAPATVHVDWGEYLGFICAEHAKELHTRWKALAHHSLGPHCGMPGAVWWDYIDGTSGCRPSPDGVPTEEPVRAVAQEVSEHV